MFGVGILNVAATASAPLHSKLHAVLSVLPLGIAQSAAAITGIAGVALIMTARGLRRGQRRAWFFSLAALSISIIGHLARGEHVPSALAALVLLLFIIAQRAQFQGTTDRGSLRNVLSRLVLIAIVAGFAATLGLEASFANRGLPSFGVLLVACFERLVGQYNIALPDGAGDFIDPVLLAIGSVLLISALYLITRPVVDRRLSSHSSTTERRLAELRARDIVKRHGRGTLDYFALRDDKQFFFFRDSLCFIGFS
jgi:lysyl-tRNA synthetase class 2